MADYRAVLIFDGDCPFCSAASSALRRLDGVGVVPWSHGAAQSFLRAQFVDAPGADADEVPFALVFVDGDAGRAWIGREAARELCERAGLPVLIGDVIRDNYEAVADAVRGLQGLEGDVDDYHGEVELTAAASDRFDDLAANARATHDPAAARDRRRR